VTPLFACRSATSALIDAVEDFLSRQRVKAILISRVMIMTSSGDAGQRHEKHLRKDKDTQRTERWPRREPVTCSDFFISKTGFSSLSEAIILNRGPGEPLHQKYCLKFVSF